MAKRLINLTVLAVAGALCCCLPGCSDGMSSVSGKVTFNGVPLETGRVGFCKTGQAMAIGNIRDGGAYELAVGGSSRLEPGTYVVTVVSYEIIPGKSETSLPSRKLLTPKKYSNRQTSELRAEIEPGTNNIDFNIESEPK